jgi:hypothetical protein
MVFVTVLPFFTLRESQHFFFLQKLSRLFFCDYESISEVAKWKYMNDFHGNSSDKVDIVDCRRNTEVGIAKY